MPERWVSQKEAMALLDVSPGTVARWARTGRLPATRPMQNRRYDVGPELEARAEAKVRAEPAARETRRAGSPPGWVRISEVAAELRISRNELLRAVRSGLLDVRRDDGWRSVSAGQVQAWVETHRVKPRG